MQIVVAVAKAIFVMMVALAKASIYCIRAALFIVGALVDAIPSKALTPEEKARAEQARQQWRQSEEDELRRLNLDYARKRAREQR